MRAVAVFLCGALLLLGDVSASDIQLFSCDFETDFCGMTQRTDDHFDWNRHSGGTDTGKTGPSSAYNGTFYIFIEATDVPPRSAAEVETGSLQHSGTACVTFAYHMYGVGSGVLVVKATSANNEWRAFNDQGDHWRPGTTEVDLRPADRVSFRAVTSSDTHGDIALDDIVIRSGGCRTTHCQMNNGGCDHICTGSGTCSCGQGYTLDGTKTCVDVNECLANETCEQRCLNTVGAYSCSCHNGYILTDDQHRCKGCEQAYDQIVDADETFASTCPTLELLYNTPRDKCLLEACRRRVEVVSIRHKVCDLKACDNGNVQLAASLGSLGWDIFVLNRTWSESLDDQPGTGQGHSNFPLWQVIIAVIVTVVVLAAIVFAVGIAVYLKRRKKFSPAKETDRVYYENDAALTFRPVGDVTKPADEAPYEDVECPPPVTASGGQTQMSPPGSVTEDPNPGGYEYLEFPC